MTCGHQALDLYLQEFMHCTAATCHTGMSLKLHERAGAQVPIKVTGE